MVTDGRQAVTEEEAELAINLLSQLVGDIEAANFTLEDVILRARRGEVGPMMFQQVMRMCLSWLSLVSTKASELWEGFGSLASMETRAKMRAALREAERRGMTSFRHNAIAHAFEEKPRRPMRPEAIQEAIKQMVGDDSLAFFHWLRHPNDPKANTMSRALRLFREDILRKFPNVRITMPISTYSTPQGDVAF